jgi:hypothetical protein
MAIHQFMLTMQFEGRCPRKMRRVFKRLLPMYYFFGDMDVEKMERRAIILFVIEELKTHRRTSAIQLFTRWMADNNLTVCDLGRIKKSTNPLRKKPRGFFFALQRLQDFALNVVVDLLAEMGQSAPDFSEALRRRVDLHPIHLL